jgi:RNA polymerase sigma-70 factor (ECF subfamily)
MMRRAMDPTPVSLLERLRNADPEAWGRFVELYTPLLFSWARKLGLQEADAADLVQDVLLLLLRKLPTFAYDRHQRFRGWLWTVVRNRWATVKRQAAPPVSLAVDVAEGDAAVEVEENEYRGYLIGRALRLMQAEFQPTTWQAFWQSAVCDRPAAEVGAELGMTVAAVYTARSRVLRRLRQDLGGLLG